MKQLVILSGKGGTGKTTIAASLVKLASNKGYADCDVDAPNLHLIHGKDIKPITNNYYGYQKAVKYYDICINCSKCEELCNFGAIKDSVLNPYECEGCGVCEYFCPVSDSSGKKAIRLEDNISGITRLYKGKEVFSSAYLEMGNGASGKLVNEVRKNLSSNITNEELLIIDGSPGIGCPVIASITGVDLVLIVAEPTISGIHDMKRIIDTARNFGIKCIICINKYDINIEKAKEIEQYCKKANISIVGKIPNDAQIIKATNLGLSIIEIEESKAKEEIIKMWDNIKTNLNL